MGLTRFDRHSRLLATRRARRQALTADGAEVAATSLLASRFGPAFAQDATPEATPAGLPADPHPSADDARTRHLQEKSHGSSPR